MGICLRGVARVFDVPGDDHIAQKALFLRQIHLGV